MINLRNYEGFALMKGDDSPEANALSIFCTVNEVSLFRIDKESLCPSKYIPVGSVEWCLQNLNKKVIPDYYPEWLSTHLHRNVWKTDKWPLEQVFIKPADRYKRFNGFITAKNRKKKRVPYKAPYWCSDVVKFTNEWRYYVSEGKILCSGWYLGDEVNTPDAPKLNIEIPKGFYGAIDLGTLDDADETLALVEVHHPVACGIYTKDTRSFAQWLCDGWSYMREVM